MSQGNTSVSERLLWRKDTLKKWPEKLKEICGSWGGAEETGTCNGQGVRRGGALGAGNLEKAEHMRRKMRGGAPPCSGLPPPRLLLTLLLQLEGRQSSSLLNFALACALLQPKLPVRASAAAWSSC